MYYVTHNATPHSCFLPSSTINILPFVSHRFHVFDTLLRPFYFRAPGKPYWTKTCQELGIFEDDDALWHYNSKNNRGGG
jgi:hypothetical protein